MALKITLKPHEKIIVAGAAITNGNAATSLFIENKVPLLREKDILREQDAHSPARRIYFTIQLMYMDQDHLTEYHKIYWGFVRDFIKAAPSALGLIDVLSGQILAAQYYKALKTAGKLVDYEAFLLAKVKGRRSDLKESQKSTRRQTPPGARAGQRLHLRVVPESRQP